MSGHTPGPWAIGHPHFDDECQRELPILARVSGREYYPAVICLQFPNAEGMQDANARLIAAAPDLLEAVRGVDAVYAELCKGLPAIANTASLDIVMEAVAKARAAIAKAEGRS